MMENKEQIIKLAEENVLHTYNRYPLVLDHGQAKVKVDGKYGTIDKTGRYIIEPLYEIVEYDDRTGRSLVRLDGRWAAFDYEGRQLTEFGAVEP